MDRAYQGGDDHAKLRGMFDFLPFDPGDFGFDLSNREIAALGYTTAFFAWAAIVTRRSVGPLLRAFLAPKILAVFVAMTLYVVASVALLAVAHLWDWPNLKTTLVWWTTFACATMFQAHRMAGERGAFRKLLRDAVNWTAVILFIAEFGSFALWVELIMLPVLTLIALLLAVVPSQPNASIIIKPLTSLQNTAGWIIFAGGLWHIAANFSEFATLNSLREFGDPILLTLLYVPFLYVLAAMMTHETTFTSLRIRTKDEALARYAERKAILAFGLDSDASKRLTRSMTLNDIADRKGVDAAIREIKRLKSVEKNPPRLAEGEGWSPYEAGEFLGGHGIVANDWHAAFDEWRAEAASVKLGDRALPDRVSYYLSGVERAATKISLILGADYMNDTAASDDAFYAMVRTLLGFAFGEAESDELLARLRAQPDLSIDVRGKAISIRWDEWGPAPRGGYTRNFTMHHEAHVLNRFDNAFYEVT